jgi:hypothetical protein
VKLEFIDAPTRSLGGAWEASWESVLRILTGLRPKMGIHYSVYVLALSLATYLLL